MKISHFTTYIILGTVLIACSSDTEPFGEQNADNSFMNIDINQVSFDENRSATVNVEASKDLEWVVVSSDSWIKIDKSSATGSSSISISVSEDNPQTTSRKGSLTLRSRRYHLSNIINVEQKGTYLNVSTSKADYPIAGGNCNVTVESNAAWSIKSTAEWLSTSISKGQMGKSSFTITAQPNTMDVERSTTIEVYTDNKAVSHKIEIIQSPIVLTLSANTLSAKPEGEQFTLGITSNSSWSISSADSWCTISPSSGNENGKVTLSVSSNTGTSNRSTTITVKSGSISRTVRVSQVCATLSVDETPITFSPEASTKTLTVTSNTNWEATSNAAWCTVKQNNGQLTISATKNDTDAQRTASVTIKALGLTKTIKVTQQKAMLTLSPSSAISFNPEGGSQSLVISTNVDWTANSDAEWCTVSIKSGKGDKTITINASENRVGSQRSAIITVKTAFHTKRVTVTQANTTLKVSKESVSFGASQSTTNIAITTNAKWTLSSSANWLSVTPSSGSGDASISITANDASSSSAREATVIVKALELSKTIKITQVGVTLDVKTTELSFAVSGGSKTVTATSNAKVSVSSNASWCTASVSGSTITIKATANTGYTREAIVTVKAGSLSRTIKVSQVGVSLEVTPSELSFTSSGGRKTATITSNVTFSAESNATWCTVSVSGSTIYVSAASNSGVSERTATVTIKAGGFSKYIRITQSGGTNIGIDDYPDDTNMN